MPILTPTGVLMGFLFPQVLLPIRPYIPWLFGVMTLSGAMKLRAKELGQAVANPIPVLLFFVASHILMPVIALLISKLLLPGDAESAAGFVLLYSTPTAVASFIWVSIYRGNGALTLAIILLDTILAPLVVPFSTRFLLGTSVAFDSSGMAFSLIAMVVIPTVIGVVLNEASKGAVPKKIGPYMGPVSKFCLILVVAANSAAVAPKVQFSEPKVWIIAAVGILMAAIGFLLGRFMGLVPILDRAKTRSITFNIGLRNISAAATLAIAFFPEAAALPAILGMVFQQSLAAIFGRLLLGKPNADETETAPQKA